MDANIARQRSRTYADLACAFSVAEPGLEQEFTRLFLGPGRPVAHPYESIYREGRTMGDATLDVRARLASAGLTPRRQTLPDHVGIELAFMAHLTASEALAWETADEDRARGYLIQQESFLRDHLTAWLPQFCNRMLAGRPHVYYANLAHRAEAFVTHDCGQVQTWLGHGSAAATAPTVERDWWSVAVDPGCTLCGICIQVCRPGALQQIRSAESREVLLHFEASLCDGCAACQRWCPEQIIKVRRAEGHPAGGALASSDILACPGCGQLHAPAAMVTRVQAQMGRVNEALLKRLTLCHDCKTTDALLRQRSTRRQDIASLSRDSSHHRELVKGRVPIAEEE
jgi:TorA maturation chaperone TorD/NAD-dependent dihydropyrimidine dehydrogenase PreA subunit